MLCYNVALYHIIVVDGITIKLVYSVHGSNLTPLTFLPCDDAMTVTRNQNALDPNGPILNC